MVYKTISDATGYDVEELHEMLKVKFALRTSFNLFEGELVEAPMSTRMMDTKQMTEYIDKIILWAKEKLTLHVSSPNEITDEHFIESKHYI